MIKLKIIVLARENPIQPRVDLEILLNSSNNNPKFFHFSSDSSVAFIPPGVLGIRSLTIFRFKVKIPTPIRIIRIDRIKPKTSHEEPWNLPGTAMKHKNKCHQNHLRRPSKEYSILERIKFRPISLQFFDIFFFLLISSTFST